MVGYYKIISEKGIEQDIEINDIKSDKDVYNFYYNKERKSKKNIRIPSLDFSPIYKEENLKTFYNIKNLVEENIKEKLSVQEIKTPDIIKNTEQLEELQQLFGLEKFNCNNNDFILRPASDFCIFSMLKDYNFAEKEIPCKIYEFAKCYRIEEKKQDSLKRPTTFHLPDIHCFLEKNIYNEVLLHLEVYEVILEKLQIPHFVALRISQNEYDKNKQDICNIAQKLRKKIVVNIVPSSIKYWEAKFKYVYKDSNNDFIQLSTVQTDYRITKIFNIKVKGKDAEIIHSSIGSMERLLYAYLDK